MTAILLRTESASSSQIEQLTTSARHLALAEIDEGDKANALTVIGNVRAMEAALRLSDDISEDSILAMHKALMLHQRGFVGQPAVNTKYMMSTLGLGEMAALRALSALADRRVLTESTGRNRNRVWQQRGILDVLDGYAETIRRMSAS